MKRITALLLSLVLALTCVPVFSVSAAEKPAVGDQFMVSVNDWLNMRSEPNTDSTIVAKLSAGTIVTLAGEYGEWAYVNGNGHTGWVASKYLKDVGDFSTQHADILARLNELRKKFPNGKYWNHYGSSQKNLDGWTETPCPSGHYLNGVQQCNGQCDGFARKLGLDLFGLSTYKWQNTSYDINTICVGDLIRYNGKHTIMVVGFTKNTNELIIADCNWDYHCVIRWDALFSTSRYFRTVNWVLHYPGNTLNRAAMLNPGATTTTTTTTSTTATTTTTTTTSKPTTTTTTTVPTVDINNGSSSGSSVRMAVRLGGDNRYETAALISAEGWNRADTVVLASAAGFADALAGAPLAYALDAPILLVDGKTISSHTMKEIIRLGADRAYVLGGTASVSDSVIEQLGSNGLSVTRIFGSDRFETAEKIAIAMKDMGAVRSDTVFFANAYNYPDALSVSSIAAASGSPILYAPAKGSISKSTVQCVQKLGADEAVVLGGNSAINSDVYSSIDSAVKDVSRCGGKDRYDTSLAICRSYLDSFTGSAVCFATGKNFPDALAGGVLAAKKGAPVVLVDNSADIENTRTFVSQLSPKTAYVFGGSSVISDALVGKLTK